MTSKSQKEIPSLRDSYCAPHFEFHEETTVQETLSHSSGVSISQEGGVIQWEKGKREGKRYRKGGREI